MTNFTEYKVVHIVEGGCGTILLGASGLPVQKMEAELNKYAQDGWQVVFQVVEQKALYAILEAWGRDYHTWPLSLIKFISLKLNVTLSQFAQSILNNVSRSMGL